MNPILQQLTNQVKVPSRILDMYKNYKIANNPNEYLQSLINNNPIISRIANEGNCKDIFFNLCKERGINPQDIIDQFR